MGFKYFSLKQFACVSVPVSDWRLELWLQGQLDTTGRLPGWCSMPLGAQAKIEPARVWKPVGCMG